MPDSNNLRYLLPITGLTCASCVSRLENSMLTHDAIESISVNLALSSADIKLTTPSATNDLIGWIRAAGFDVEYSNALFTISGVSCAGCVTRIETALLALPGVTSAAVNLASAQLKVVWVKGVALESDITQKLSAINYPVLKTDQSSPKSKHLVTKSLGYQTIISCILSLPMLVAMVGVFMGFQWMLPAWLQLALTLPVQFVIGSRFYVGAYHSLKGGSANMDVLVALGTSTAFFYSLYLWLFTSSAHLYFEASAVVISLVMLGKWLEEHAKNVTSNAIRQLSTLQPASANKWQNSVLVKTDISDLQINDQLQITPGEVIPADGIILEGTTAVDESMLTGESTPVDKSTNDLVLAGTTNYNGSIRIQLQSTAENFRLKQIIDLVNNAQMQKPEIQKAVDKIASVFVPAVIVIAALTLGIQWWLHSFDFAVLAAISVLVIACPCALGLATPTAIIASSGVGARHGVLIRDVNQLRHLANASVLVFDKTGTLTEGNPKVVNATWWSDDPKLKSVIKSIAQKSQHPLANAVNLHLTKVPNDNSDYHFENISGRGAKVTTDSNRYLFGNDKLMLEQNVTIPAQYQLGIKANHSLVWVAVNDTVIARFDIEDQLRSDAKQTINQLQSQGIETWMLSGDRQVVADLIANELGIDHVLAELMPEHKVQAVQQLMKKHSSVVMIGDGINDAPALAAANASIAMGNGTDVAIDSAGITLMQSRLSLAIVAINIAKKTQQKIKQNLFWAFFYNCVCIPLAVAGYLSPVIAGAAMALSSVSVVGSSILLLNWKPTEQNQQTPKQ